MRLARAQLLCRLAVAIKHAARKQQRRLRLQHEAGVPDARIQAPGTNSGLYRGTCADNCDAVNPTELGIAQITTLGAPTQGLSFLERQIQKLDTIMRMWFLAFLSDHSFTRELSYAWDATDSTEGAMPLLGALFFCCCCSSRPPVI
jgi:hypothetical protein